MAREPKGLMICLVAGLPVIMVGLGLATSPRPRLESGGAYPLVVTDQTPVPPIQMSAPAMQMPAPAMPALMPLPRQESLVAVNQVIPQRTERLRLPPATSLVLVPSLPEMPSLADVLPFQEAHWQGLELVPATASLRRSLKITSDAKGVIVDEATWPADMEGFQAADLITSVGEVPTPTLEDFIQAADRVRNRRRTEIELVRKNKVYSIVLSSLQANGRLGTGNGETAQMIKAGSRSPHGYLGACTNCHRIGGTGQLASDQGDLLTRAAPPIRAGQTPPHRNRGECTACHTFIP